MSPRILGFCLWQLWALHLGHPHQGNGGVHLAGTLVKNTYDTAQQSACYIFVLFSITKNAIKLIDSPVEVIGHGKLQLHPVASPSPI